MALSINKAHLKNTFVSAAARAKPNFVELLAKTNFSFLEGASHPEEMIQQGHAVGYSTMGIVDHNGVYGIPRAHGQAKTSGMKLIVGAEVVFEKGHTAFLLVKNHHGYGNLCELLTQIHCEGEEKAQWKWILEKEQDLFLLLPAVAVDETVLPELKATFGDRLYLVASRFLDGKDALNLQAAEALSRQHQIKVVASNQPIFHLPSRKILQDVLSCIRHTCTLWDGGFHLQPNTERHLKKAESMAELFPHHPEWLAETLAIAEQCQFSLDEIKYHYPQEWIPAGETGDSFLEKLTRLGAQQKYGEVIPLAVEKQIQHELDLIRDLQYSDYFLTIWDIVKFARSQNILCQGRGSAANSLVCYLLGITAIDPIRMDLLFERFLSRERREPPDIDIDFEHERREEVIQYIYTRYGRNRSAISAEVICYRRRSAMREVAKAFAIPTEVVEKFLLMTQKVDLRTLKNEDLIAVAPEIKPRILRQYFSVFFEILAFPRHIGTHVGGFVLCHDLLTRNIPVEKAAMEGRTIVQWDKNDLDALGFVRVDILGLGILTCLRKCMDEIRTTYGKDLRLATIPSEDPKVYEAFQAGDTVGVFQIESRAQMSMLPRLKPKNFFDLVVEISIVRPGPIQGEMVHPYLRRRAGLEKVEYPHPELEAILKKTYGVPLFQEQIMKMAMQVANFSGGEADELRRAMGTWRRDGHNRLFKMGERFCQGLVAKGIPQEFAERVFNQVKGFAEYGFPESHAASFAIIAYASGYLRLYYPDAYLCAILNSQPMGFYRSHSLVYDAQRHGVKVHGIDVLRSHWDNLLERPGEVRLGFREIKGFPEKTARALEAMRVEKGFSTFFDFVVQLKEKLHPKALTKRELFLIAGSNGFESLGLARREAFWEIQALPLQDSTLLSATEDSTPLPQEKPWERISLDYENHHLSLFQHPMAYFRENLDPNEYFSSLVLKPPASRFLRAKRAIKVAGIVICRQMPPTASGVLFITLEDEFGFINLVIWNAVFQKYRDLLLTQSFLIAEGRIEKPQDANIIHVIVEKVEPLLLPQRKTMKIESHDFQ